MTRYTDVELCAGAGGQAHGLELAGFKHVALVEMDKHACETLRLNRPQWNVIEDDLHKWDPSAYEGVDLISGGVPCPPFSIAGRQLGALDDRELFGRALEIIRQVKPRGVMLENVRGLLDPKFDAFRKNVSDRLRRYGYSPQWRLLQASDYGVSQLRPRVICVALKPTDMKYFTWPEPDGTKPPTVGELLGDLMAGTGWNGGIDDDAPSRVLYEARLGRLAVMFAESASDRQCRRLAGGLGDGSVGTACGIIDDAFLGGPDADMAVYALAKSLAAKIEDPGPSADTWRLAEHLARNRAVSDAYLADGDWCRVPVGDVLLTAGGAMEEPRLRALMEEVMRSAADGRRGWSGGRIAHRGGKAES